MNNLKCKVLMEANQLAINTPGYKYSVGQILTFDIKNNDTIEPIQIEVTQIDENNGIKNFNIINKGTYKTISNLPYTVNDKNSRFTYNITIKEPGFGYIVGDKVYGGNLEQKFDFIVTEVYENPEKELAGLIRSVELITTEGLQNITIKDAVVLGGTGYDATFDLESIPYSTPDISYTTIDSNGTVLPDTQTSITIDKNIINKNPFNETFIHEADLHIDEFVLVINQWLQEKQIPLTFSKIEDRIGYRLQIENKSNLNFKIDGTLLPEVKLSAETIYKDETITSEYLSGKTYEDIVFHTDLTLIFNILQLKLGTVSYEQPTISENKDILLKYIYPADAQTLKPEFDFNNYLKYTWILDNTLLPNIENNQTIKIMSSAPYKIDNSPNHYDVVTISKEEDIITLRFVKNNETIDEHVIDLNSEKTFILLEKLIDFKPILYSTLPVYVELLTYKTVVSFGENEQELVLPVQEDVDISLFETSNNCSTIITDLYNSTSLKFKTYLGASLLVDWCIKSVEIIDNYYMFTYPNITIEPNSNAIVKPNVDCKGYLIDVSVVNPGYGFWTTPTINVTGKTESQIYYEVWNGTIVDETRAKHMADVISHFESLGYNIKQQLNPKTGNTFQWVVSWNQQ